MRVVHKEAPGSAARRATAREAPPGGAPSNFLWFAGGMLAALILALAGFWVVKAVQPPTPATSRADSQVDSGPRVGQQAPDFQLQSLSGQPISLTQYRGSPVMINFWASWCPPCKAEMPDIEQAVRKHQGQGLVVLGIDEQEDEATVRKFLQERGFSWTFLLDGEGRVGDAYRVTALPTSVFLDRTGKVRAVQIGIASAEQLEAKLSRILTD